VNGGFQFFEAATGWSSTPHIGFDPTVAEIIEHRKANPRLGLSTDPNTVATELEKYVEGRLRSVRGGEKFLIEGTSPPSFTLPLPVRRLPTFVAEGAKIIKNTVAGIGLWQEFFGAGPVNKELAEKRAAVCVACPKNQPGNIFTRFSQVAAREITAIFEALHQKQLNTTHDAALGVCAACSCPNRSNVWTPINIKLKHLRAETKAELPAHCWVITEEKQGELLS
jgi:hypothetical protein